MNDRVHLHTLSHSPFLQQKDKSLLIETSRSRGGVVVVVSRDDSAGDPGAGVARLEALGVAAVAQVVDAGVHYDGAA